MGNLQAYREEGIPYVIVTQRRDGERFLMVPTLGASVRDSREALAGFLSIESVLFCRDTATGRFV